MRSSSDGLPETSIELIRSADMRYVGQEYHLNVYYPISGERREATEAR